MVTFTRFLILGGCFRKKLKAMQSIVSKSVIELCHSYSFLEITQKEFDRYES